MFLGFGAGMTWGANIVRWHGPDAPETTSMATVAVIDPKVTGTKMIVTPLRDLTVDRSETTNP